MFMSVASSRHGKRPDCHYCFALFQGLYRARRRCGRGRCASLIPVGFAPDIPFTRPWAAMPPTAAPRPRFRKTWMERFSKQLPQAKKKRPRSTPQSLKNVRAKGLEPIRTKAPDPKSGLATNYNTLANPFRKTHNIKPIAEYDLVGSCRILCPKRNAKIVKDFQFSKPVRIFVKNTEKKYDICASKKTNRKNCGPELETKTG